MNLKENSITYSNFPILDGLRGVSILWVLIHHIPIGFPDWLEAIRKRGDLGVELFFAISGFLVCRSLHQCLLKQKQSDFIKRRIFRIFPPFFLTLFAIWAISIFDKSLAEKIKSIQDIIFSFPTFTYNYFKQSTTGIVPGSLNIFWSLCFEEQFYIVLFIISCFAHKNLKNILLVLMLASIFLRNILLFFTDSISHQMLQMQTHLRLDAILMASIIYLNWEKVEKYKVSFLITIPIAILGIVLHQHIPLNFSGLNYLLISTSFTIIIFTSIKLPMSYFSQIFSNKILVFIGTISYEIYLIHEIIIGIGKRAHADIDYKIYIAFSIIGSIAIAFLFFKLFSNPVNQFLRRKFLSDKNVSKT
jgi:peptidoglycan/LPS O-acetylase OafA/YrhL